VKILVVSNIYPPVVRGGYEVECAAVVELLRNRGDEVRVLTSRVDDPIPSERGISRSLHEVAPKGRALKLAPLTTLLDRRAVDRELTSFAPDLAYVWNGAHIPHVTIHDLLATGVPTAFRICEHWFGDLFSNDPFMRYLSGGGSAKRRVWSLGIRAVNTFPGFGLERSVEAQVGVAWASRFMRDNVPRPVGLHCAVERVIHPTTQSASRFAALRRAPSATPLIAFVGRLSREKGSDVVVGALGSLTARGHDARLVLAGSGSERDVARLQAGIDAAGIANKCTFAGRLDTNEVCALLQRATVLAVPSIWEEPFPITMIEGALSRVPIVASSVGGIPEVLANGEEVLLAPPDDPEAFAAAIESVLVDPDDANRRAERAFSRAKTLSWETYASQTTAFVDDTLQAVRASASRTTTR
jgi:glycogen synthase